MSIGRVSRLALALAMSAAGCQATSATPAPPSPTSIASAVPTPTNPAVATPTAANQTPGPSIGAEPDATWVDTSLQAVHVRRPQAWQASAPDDSHVVLVPPDKGTPDLPVPAITIAFLPGKTLADVPPPTSAGVPTSLTIAGYPAWQADETDLPPLSRYVAVEVAGGVVLAQADRTPGDDLTAYLEGILSTLTAQ